MTRRELEFLINNVAATARTSGRLRENRDIMMHEPHTMDEFSRTEKASSDAVFASARAKTQAINDIVDALGLRE